MKKKVNKGRKGKYLILTGSLLLVLDILLLVAKFFVPELSTQIQTISYTEEGNVDTAVFLKDNEFYADDYRETSDEFVASLIDHIDADFKYSLSSEEDLALNGKYKIMAEVDVLDKTTHNTIYNHKEDLVSETEFKPQGEFSTVVPVNYAKFNELIKKFIEVYDLDGTESTLTVKMIVDVSSGTEREVEKTEKTQEISFSVPLTEKTVAVSIDSNEILSSDFLKVKQKRMATPFLIAAAVLFMLTVLNFLAILIKRKRNRSPEDRYRYEIERILKDYASFLQTVSSPYKVGKMQLVEVETLEDLFEIRDSLQAPILMYSKEKPKQTEFVIPPSENNTVYRFIFKISDV